MTASSPRVVPAGWVAAISAAALLAAPFALSGCASIKREAPLAPGPSLTAISDPAPDAPAGDRSEALLVASADYERAFDAAEEVARTYGLMAALRDRRAGIIETDPAIAGSLLEPWDRATRTLGQALENTLSLQRRRARFEFRPAEHDDEPATQGGQRLPDDPPLDLTLHPGPLELHVSVFIERAHVPGIRRSPWSRRLTSQMEIVDPETGRAARPAWTVVSRDPALEARMRMDLSRRLGR